MFRKLKEKIKSFAERKKKELKEFKLLVEKERAKIKARKERRKKRKKREAARLIARVIEGDFNLPTKKRKTTFFRTKYSFIKGKKKKVKFI